MQVQVCVTTIRMEYVHVFM